MGVVLNDVWVCTINGVIYLTFIIVARHDCRMITSIYFTLEGIFNLSDAEINSVTQKGN